MPQTLRLLGPMRHLIGNVQRVKPDLAEPKPRFHALPIEVAPYGPFLDSSNDTALFLGFSRSRAMRF